MTYVINTYGDILSQSIFIHALIEMLDVNYMCTHLAICTHVRTYVCVYSHVHKMYTKIAHKKLQ